MISLLWLCSAFFFALSLITDNIIFQLAGLPVFCAGAVSQHELSHALMCRMKSVDVKDVIIFGFSLNEKKRVNCFKSCCIFKRSRFDSLVYLSGILGTALLLALTLLFHLCVRHIYIYLFTCMIYLISNMMPVKGSDMTNLVSSLGLNPARTVIRSCRNNGKCAGND